MDADKTKSVRHHYKLEDIERFVRTNQYPFEIDDWGKRSNFRRACKKFSIVNGIFMYKIKRVVIMERKRQLEIIKDIHEGLGESEASKKVD